MSEPKVPAKMDPGQLLVQEKARVKRPPMYAVVLLNDDYTPMEFVIWVLQGVFYKTPDEASRLTLQVHNEGRGIAGVFTHDVARTKVLQVEQLAREHEHPLQCEIEACEG